MKLEKLKPTEDTIGDADFDNYRKFKSGKLQLFKRRLRKEFFQALKQYIKEDVFSDSFRVIPNEYGKPNLLQIGFPKSISPLNKIGSHIKLLQFFKPHKTAKKYEPVLFQNDQMVFPIKEIFTGFFFEKNHYKINETLSTQKEYYYFVWGDLILRKNLIEECEFATDEMKAEWWKALEEAENEYNKTKKYKAGQMVKPFKGTQNVLPSSSNNVSSSSSGEELTDDEVDQTMARLFELLEQGIDDKKDRDSKCPLIQDSSSSESESDTLSDECEDSDADDSRDEIKFGGKSKSSKRTSILKFEMKPKNKASVGSNKDHEIVKRTKTTSKLPLELVSKPNETVKSKHKRIGSDEGKYQSNRVIKGIHIKSTSKLESKPDNKILKNNANSLKRSFASCLMQADANNSSNKSKKIKSSSYIIEKKSNEFKLERERSISKQTTNQSHHKFPTKASPEQKFSNKTRDATPKQKNYSKFDISEKGFQSFTKFVKPPFQHVPVSNKTDKTENKYYRFGKDETKTVKVDNETKNKNESNSKHFIVQNVGQINNKGDEKLEQDSSNDLLKSESIRMITNENESPTNSLVNQEISEHSGSETQNEDSNNLFQVHDSPDSALIESIDEQSQRATSSISESPMTPKVDDGTTISIESQPNEDENSANSEDEAKDEPVANPIKDKDNSPDNLKAESNEPSSSSSGKDNQNEGNKDWFDSYIWTPEERVQKTHKKIPKLKSRPIEQNSCSASPESASSSKNPLKSLNDGGKKNHQSDSKQTLGWIIMGPTSYEKSRSPYNCDYSEKRRIMQTNKDKIRVSLSKSHKEDKNESYRKKKSDLIDSVEMQKHLSRLFRHDKLKPYTVESKTVNGKTKFDQSGKKPNSYADSAICIDSGSPSSSNESKGQSSSNSPVSSKSSSSIKSQNIPTPQSKPEKGPLAKLANDGKHFLMKKLSNYRALVLSMVHYERPCNGPKTQYYLLTALHYVDEADKNAKNNIDQKPVTTRILNITIVEKLNLKYIGLILNRVIKKHGLTEKHFLVATEDALKAFVPTMYRQLSPDLIGSKFQNQHRATNFNRSIPDSEQIGKLRQTLAHTCDTILDLINSGNLPRYSLSDWSFIKMNKDLFECAQFRRLHGNNFWNKYNINKKQFGFE